MNSLSPYEHNDQYPGLSSNGTKTSAAAAAASAAFGLLIVWTALYFRISVPEKDATDQAGPAFIAALRSGARSTVTPGPNDPYRTRRAKFSNAPASHPPTKSNSPPNIHRPHPP